VAGVTGPHGASVAQVAAKELSSAPEQSKVRKEAT